MRLALLSKVSQKKRKLNLYTITIKFDEFVIVQKRWLELM